MNKIEEIEKLKKAVIKKHFPNYNLWRSIARYQGADTSKV